MPRRLLPSLLLLLALPADGRADEVADRIKSLINGPDYKHSRWGILAVECESGRVVFEHNPDLFCVPASVTKLFSCAAALVAFGPAHRFETPVHRRGDLVDGRLKGDLILVASGDFTLGGRALPDGKLAFHNNDHIYANWLTTRARLTEPDPLAGLNALARQVKASGVHHIDGEVLIDERLFARARGSGSGPDVLTPIVVNDNLLDVTIAPGPKAGEDARVETRPKTDFLVLDSQVHTAAAEQPVILTIERVGPQRYALRGQVPAGSAPLLRICPVDDPAAFARALFVEALRREGVRVAASIHQPPLAVLPDPEAIARLPRVAAHRSEPFAEQIKVTLKVSHNLYAGLLPIHVGLKHGKRTLADGMKEKRRILQELGVEVSALSFDSGAGGGNGDRVTPRATVQLLRAMVKRPEFAAFKHALPILGVDGTLAEAVDKASPARGKVFAKTGTYGDMDLLNERFLLRSKALAGYLTTAAGKELAFALFVNDTPLPSGIEPSREGKLLGRICEVLHQHGP
jgi:D-alanyl-D-alanine carboxypeptidase/D-alanyl-D-alanine-endopeptidase (penicillin-binding protein 4)